MGTVHIGDRMRKLRRDARLSQEGLAIKAGVHVDVVRRLEQKRKHSARLPTLHALSRALGVELAALIGDPPAVPSTGDAEPAGLVAVRRAIMPPMFAPPPVRDEADNLSVDLLRQEIAEAWSLYHAADFGRVMELLPDTIADARLAAAVGAGRGRLAGQHALGKALQLAGHLAIRLGKTDLGLTSLERAVAAADAAEDPLLTAMMCNSIAWAYQRQNRLDDAQHLAVAAADSVERDHLMASAEHLRVWGGLIMSAATSTARNGDYTGAADMMVAAEKSAARVPKLPASGDGRMVSVFSRSSVRIERVRLAVQHARPEEALTLARGLRLSADTPTSWRTWLLLDVARAYTDLGNSTEAVAALTKLNRVAPGWIRHHTLAVAIVTDLLAGPENPPGLRQLARQLNLAD
ncbi:helix-turn-helix transcriptional regulator [Kitasatospora sp. NA04385]|uniref:helix-turn-helix domain-containing protein n=1 Tax=Kitasatospora sp. NA04385 TaxID=2742135 RepID=UPI001591305D|nr:helix-turn-helix transcriptional regulator [Kitasatospora sp. NA04385]QKW20974.1 helix-turn-helix transcriptional regulator [Kitasatospora sp. NA04385]